MKTESHELFNLLISKGFEVKTLDDKGKEQDDVSDAEMFSFDFISNGNNYGTVIILLNSVKEVEIFYGDNIGKSMDSEDKEVWMDLLYQLRHFSRRNFKGFKLNDISKLKYALKGHEALKESLFEGYYGTKKTSYNPQGNAKIIIKHSKPIEEGDRRYYNINSIFIENADGERFKLPFTKLAGARAMARHVTEGGLPYDAFGHHITEMVKNINTLGGFVRKSKMFEEDEGTQEYLMAGKEYYKDLRKNLKRLSGKRGYHAYREEWKPDEITAEEAKIEELRTLFTEKSLNPAVEDALPILAKIMDSYKTEPRMKEVEEYEQWADNIVEGTWTLPNTKQKIQQLRELMSTEQPVGVDALDITGKLDGIIGNDTLFDELLELARDNPEADARPAILDWLKRNMPEIKLSLKKEPQEKKPPQKEDEPKVESLDDELDADTEEQKSHKTINKIQDKFVDESELVEFKELVSKITKI